MRAAGRLLLIGVAPVRPVYDLERRRSRATNVALEAAALTRDRDTMPRVGMRFSPRIENRLPTALIDMPSIKGVFGGPASRGRDDQISRLEEVTVGKKEFMQPA